MPQDTFSITALLHSDIIHGKSKIQIPQSYQSEKSTTIENKLPFCLQVHSGDGPMNMEADDNFLSSILLSEMTKTQGPPKENTQNKIKIVQEKENTLDSNRTSKEICQTLLHHQIVPAKIY